MVKALHRGFSNSPKIRRLADPVPLTLDLLNPKSTGFDRLSQTIEEFQVILIRGFRFILLTYTETAVVSLVNDLIRAVDDGRVSALVLLDLSSAFDTVDHDCLLTVLHDRFAVTGPALDWFRSYLSERTQTRHSLLAALNHILFL